MWTSHLIEVLVSFLQIERKSSFHSIILLLYGFIDADLRPLAAPQVSYFPKEYSHCILCRGISWSCAVHTPACCWSCRHFFPWGASFKQILLFSFLFLKKSCDGTRKKNLCFSLEAGSGSIADGVFFQSFLPPPASSFWCHSPIPHVFQPKMPRIKPV